MSHHARFAALCLLAATAFAVDPKTSAEEVDNDQAVMSAPVVQTKPADERYFKAMQLLRDTKPEEQAKGRLALREAADGESSQAQNFLGYCLLNGQFGFKKEPRKAFNLFKLASDHGNAFAQMNLGLCYMQGTGCDKDPAKAISCFEACVSEKADFSSPTPLPDAKQVVQDNKDQGPIAISGSMPVEEADRVRATSHLCLGDLLTNQKQGALGQEHYVLAATMGPGNRAGIYAASMKAAINFAFGQGVPRDMKRADEMLSLSKKLLHRGGMNYAHALIEQKQLDDLAQDEVEASIARESEQFQTKLQNEIAGSFADPKSKNYDAKEALKWYELAAESGDTWALLNLAFIHSEGRLGKADPVKAFEEFKQVSEKGLHRLGTANYSICLENGIGTAPNHAKALEIWKQNERYDIVSHLGMLGQCPKTLLNYEQHSELTQLWAEKKKDPLAQYLWAERLFNGWGVKADSEKALQWLKKAADAGHPQALCQLGLLCENQPASLHISDRTEALKQALAFYARAAESGDVHATTNLGHMYYEGIGCVSDEARALAYFEKALTIDAAFPRAINGVGIINHDRLIKARNMNLTSAAEHYTAVMLANYTKASELKFPYATYNLGILYYDGVLQKMDKQAAFSYFETAAEQGYPAKIVHYRLGVMLENGEGMPISLREAAYHYRLAALDNSYDALRKLCQLYTREEGFTQDWDRAINWLSLLVQRTGNPDGLVDIGDALINKGDFGNAYTLFKKLSSDESPTRTGVANERLSRFYRDGTGVKMNQAKAKKYFEKALKMNNRDAQFRQSEELYKQGKRKESFDFLNKAAKQGLPAAVMKVALLSLKGEGVPRNEKFGYACLRNVAKEGSTKAMIILIEGTLQKNPNAPDLEEALHYAERMQACEHPRAAELLRQLEALREQKS